MTPSIGGWCPGRCEAQEIDSGVYMLRIADYRVKFFDSVWEVPEGVTYNAYLVAGPEKLVLVGLAERRHAAALLELLRRAAGPRDLDAVVLQHTSHLAAAEHLLREAGGVRLYTLPGLGEPPGLRAAVLEPGEGISLGGGWRLFLPTGQPPWPGGILVLEPHGLVFTGDLFSGYSTPPIMVDREDVELFSYYTYFMRKYFATVIGPYRGRLQRLLEKLAALGPRLLAPLHGLALEARAAEALQLYTGWARGRLDPGKAVAVYLDLDSGPVAEAVERLAEALEEKDVDVAVYGFTETRRPNISEILGDAVDAAYIVMGFGRPWDGGAPPPLSFLVNLLCSHAASRQRLLILHGPGATSPAALLAARLQACGMEALGALEPRGDWLHRALGKLLSGPG
ncbi:hypothetical protein CF15_07010 [Pyrodictium occultum]|uniref:Metallo-beta-lactamase domain-containing protein n=1 Tax=Pyrodictium occultum TaxID=2309 RepID=A0A0V8RWN8_PYROC|nr:MBL fold metallo-hydrolase [Pyrodictium occultum]KSW12464.1 hypothetical protein CF15_07010 [Pyrodictium occultum]